jgi:hypothetical protein
VEAAGVLIGLPGMAAAAHFDLLGIGDGDCNRMPRVTVGAASSCLAAMDTFPDVLDSA